jgi:putative Mg2+ transporter-C (MgtC) family protein
METWWHDVAKDFIDLPSPGRFLQVTVRLVLAAALGGLIGLNRQRSGKAAGLRTHMLVALGSATLAAAPSAAGVPIEAVTRIVQGIMAGIGFLGGGAILKGSDEQHISGLTTAASLWLTAAVGIVAGLGYGVSALLTAGLGWLILAGLRRVEAAVHSLSGPPRGDSEHMAD